MMEIRFRLILASGRPSPFRPWFHRAPDACVHASGFRFRGDLVECRYLAMAGDANLDAFVEDLLAHPPPGATSWSLLEKHQSIAVFAAAWREPVMPSTPSTIWIARELFGPEAVLQYTVLNGSAVHRYLVPTPRLETSNLWGALRDAIQAYAEATGTGLRIELERLAPWHDGAPLESHAGNVVHLAAHSLGYYETPPRASLDDLVLATGLPVAAVRAHLEEMERRILGDAP